MVILRINRYPKSRSQLRKLVTPVSRAGLDSIPAAGGMRPSERYLRPARAFSIGENVAKAGSSDNCLSRISYKLQQNKIE